MTPSPPFDLRCEYLKDPLGVDTPMPRFSWLVESPNRRDRQKAFQVVVSSALELLRNDIGDYWDSGKVERDQTALVEYQGEMPLSCTRYFWKIRWWNGEDAPSPWSEPASFVTGFLNEGEWKPKWISARYVQEFRSKGNVLVGESGGDLVQSFGIYLRKELSLREKPVFALAFISGLGYYELRLNGEKVGDRVLDPGWTDYNRKALYSTYDLTALLENRNAFGVILGNGRHIKNFGYEPPKLACRIEVEYESGDREILFSDESWKSSQGPLQENGLYFGERYDARLEVPGWDRPGFDDSGWDIALPVSGPPVSSQMMPPVRVTERLKPFASYRLGDDRHIFDFGQNFSGWVRLKVKGPAGTEIRLRYAELLSEDGALNTENLENAEATDVYILKGDGVETFEPRFTYHGFRYVEVTGYPGEPTPEDLEGCFVHTDVERRGQFSCSNDLVNDIHKCVIWGQLSNLMSIPTDCPQRDERHGWLGDAHLSAEEALFNFDMAAFYTKFLDDIKLAQKPDGSLSDIAPPYLSHLYPADPAWSSAYAGILWFVYRHTGDTRLIAKHYQGLKRYIQYLGSNAVGHIVKNLGKYGDWCPPGSMVPKKTPVEFTSTWYYYHDVLLMAKMAAVVGRIDEAKEYNDLADQIREAFNTAFLEDKQYAAVRISRVDNYPHQTPNALPLYLDMVPAEKKDKVLESLDESVTRRQDDHVDTGILGTRYILDVLSENGRADTAYRMATRASYPGWGYMLQEGATTLWERWEKLEGRGMNSHNHIMFGSVDAWFYRVLAGLSPFEPGWKMISFKPFVLGDLTRVDAEVRTIRGNTRISWTKNGEALVMSITVPVGSAGRVSVPLPEPKARIVSDERILWDSGKAWEEHQDIVFKEIEDGRPVFETVSGTFRFEVTGVSVKKDIV